MRFPKTRVACSAPQLWRALVVALVLVISVLQVVHITLLSRLEARRTRSEDKKNFKTSALKPVGSSYYGFVEVGEDRARMQRLIEDSNVLDVSGEYSIVNQLQNAEYGHLTPLLKHGTTEDQRECSINSPIFHALFNRLTWGAPDVTLVTQTTLNHLGHIESLATEWGGPVSVAIFATDLSTVVEAVIQLRSCFPQVRHNVSFHLVYPLNSKSLSGTAERERSSSLKTGECSTLGERLRDLSTKTNYDHGDAYPVNLLRNVGRKNSKTEFVLVVDVDLMMNSGLRDSFVHFAKVNSLFSRYAEGLNEVFVVPAFEALESIQMPKDKKELIALLSNNQARPFYMELCHKCHKHTDYETWVKAPNGNHLEVLYQISWKDPWEPFYFAHNSVPLYDERFRQYGFNRISQACELHVAGYTFAVLNNAFLVHRGFKLPSSFHSEKNKDLERNRQNFRQFKNELKTKYKDSPRRCY